MVDVPVADELALPLYLATEVDHRQAERTLRDRGWISCGAGDWAIALRSPSGRYAARISPFDPAAPYNARLYRQARSTHQVPELVGEVDLDGGANVLLMEFLLPVEEQRAVAFADAVATGAPVLADLSAHLAAVHQQAQHDLTWCGPIDTNPSNVMQNLSGQLVLIDPFYADGPNLYGSLLTSPVRVAASIPFHRRRHMFDLPLAHTGPPEPGVLDRMRRALAAADTAHSHMHE